MNSIQRADRDLMRGINRSIILNVIKAHGPISRADIAHLTGLSPATVTSITGLLIEEDLIFEKSTGDSSGGRPPILLALNPRGGFVIGIKLMESQAVAALTDLNATVIEKTNVELRNTELTSVIDELVLLVENLMKNNKIPKKRLFGVGIGLAGVIDSVNGILRKSPFFGWKDVPFRDLLDVRLKVPIFLDNDVNTLTLGEKWLDNGVHADNYVVITVGRGIGMGIIINGQIYRGKGGGAGEFGHLVVNQNGPVCDCGKRGCLESYLGDQALVMRAKHEVDPSIESIDELIQMAAGGNIAAGKLFEWAGDLLGQELANLINLLDPKLIIISGEGVRMGDPFFSSMRAAIQKNAVPELFENTEIRINTWGDDVWARGAASLVIGELFNSPIQKEER
ncbi:MAG: ROK family transcriptional regulator [Pelolinea sp.]|jgi:predicted NBD/HSP70 family sugar kinase|nr:ROK family transcriptional regulator [Pelolinea sp.]